MPYFSNASEPFQINLTASCNFGCECDMNDVQPVCGANGLTYFSPCHAGCTSLGANSDNYTNCACVLNTMQQPSPLVSSAASGVSAANSGENFDLNFKNREKLAFLEIKICPIHFLI